MKEQTILVIDDSSTIRRLVDRELTSAGYRVVLAENAEVGISAAKLEKPDLIILDHQLPGTTGFNVCGILLKDDELLRIPVVVSSTLRKKAYVEYTDCSNVVDMLPKPYTGDLLRTTVANALDTALLIVHSQSAGTAVPEVIDAYGDADLHGTFSMFNVRELIDFLNNGSKHGVLELDCERSRIFVFLENGRIQAVTASGIDPADVAEQLPTSLADLGPMVKFTIAGRQSSQLDGLVELLNNKILDARLLRQLLRHQAAVLLSRCFETPPKSFRFDSGKSAAALFTKLPLDLSLLAILVDASMMAPSKGLGHDEVEYTRKSIRGQNLDRAGLSGTHMKLLSLLNNPLSATELSSLAGCAIDETRCVMRGFEMAELVRSQPRKQLHNVIVLCSDAERAQRISKFLLAHSTSIQGRVVRDALSVKLLMRRFKPDLLLCDLDHASQLALCKQLQSELKAQLCDTKWYGITDDSDAKVDGVHLDGLIPWNGFEDDLRARLNFGADAPACEASHPELAGCV